VSKISNFKTYTPDVKCTHRLYKGLFFTIAVGPDKEIFTAHANVLIQSPVLAKLTCEIDNVEAGSIPHIDLPDDDPKLFGCLLEYLYQGRDVYQRCLAEGPHNGDHRTVFLADLYTLAEDSQLEGFLPIAAQLLLDAEPASYVTFFETAQKVWASIAAPGHGPFFEQYYYPRIRRYVHVSAGAKWFDDMVLSGTSFGRELYKTMTEIVKSGYNSKQKRLSNNDEDSEVQRRIFKKTRPSRAEFLHSA